MYKKLISIVLAALLIIPFTRPHVIAATLDAENETRMAEKVKAGIAKLGVGPEARVKLTLKNKTKLAGYISAIEDERFVVTNLKTNHATNVVYTEVAQMQGNNLTTRTKIIITAAIVAGVIITLYLVRGAFCDGC
ncbi:MAG: hypothetical protein JST85_09370 [Acidobacteria bacterium]|nr:hypothetical protein [Acidobacteriota bacterium]